VHQAHGFVQVEAARAEIEDLLKPEFKETGTEYKIQKDEFNYIWVVLKDKDFEDLVTNIQMVSQIPMEQRFGTQILVAVCRFKGENTFTGFTAHAWLKLSFRAERKTSKWV
jgi:hypothetical protein